MRNIIEIIISDMEAEIEIIIDLIEKLPDNTNVQKIASRSEAEKMKNSIMNLNPQMKKSSLYDYQ